MSEMKSGSALDGVSRKKLHLRTFELRKEQQRLKGLIKIVKPAEIPDQSLEETVSLGQLFNKHIWTPNICLALHSEPW